MKKCYILSLLLMLMIPAFGQNVIEIGESNGTDAYLPYYTYYCYSLTQQIYTADEIGAECLVDSIGFYLTSGSSTTRNVSIYMKNTSRESFANSNDWEQISAENLVYQGNITYPSTSGWFNIALDSLFVYDGTSNLLVCFDDNTGSWVGRRYSNSYTGNENRSIYVYSDDTNYDPFNTNNYSGNRRSVKNVIRLHNMPTTENLQISPKQIAMGYRPSGYWMEPFKVKFNNMGIPVTVSSIDVENCFFVLSGIDTPKTFNIDEKADLIIDTDTAESGEINTNITISYQSRGIDTVSLSATAYNPERPDVWELARNVSFTNNSYTDTPTEALYDNYNLPNEQGNNPDAVYKMVFDKDFQLTVNVGGENSQYEIYKDGFNGLGGPAVENAIDKGGNMVDVVGAKEDTTSSYVKTYRPGTYYLVAAASENLSISIDKNDNLPVPFAAYSPIPQNDEYDIDASVNLLWNFGNYTTEYRLMFGNSPDYMTAVVDWTDDLRNVCELDNLEDNKTYYWRVDERNTTGTTTGNVWKFNTIHHHYVHVTDYHVDITANLYYALPGDTIKVTATPEAGYELGSLFYRDYYSWDIVANIDTAVMHFVMPNFNVYVDANMIAVPLVVADIDTFDMGYRPNGYWMKPVALMLKNEGADDANIGFINIDGNYFEVVDTDFPLNVPAKGIKKVSIASGTGLGLQTSTIVAGYEKGTINIPVKAVGYNPVCPDVWEMAREVATLPYTDTPTEGSTLYGNYCLVSGDDNTKDAVYKLVLTEDVLLSASVDNGKVALYNHDFNGLGGPDFSNKYKYKNENITTHSSYFEESFENGLPSNWHALEKKWVCDSTLTPHGGNKYMVSKYQQNSYVDYWLVMPRVSIGENSSLSFYFNCKAGNSRSESLYIMLSTSGYEYSSYFSEIYREDLKQTDTLWQKRTIDLSQYAGQTVYLAFKHYVEDGNNFCLKLDDVTFDGGSSLARCAKNSSLALNQVENLKHENEALNRSSSDSGENSCGPAPFTNAVKSQAFRGPESLSLISLWQNSKHNLCTFNLNNPNNCNPLGVTPNFFLNSAAYYDGKCYFSSNSGYFGTIDVNTGGMTLIKENCPFMVIEFNPTNGKLYGTGFSNTTSLYEINPLDGTCTQIATFNVGYMISFTITNDGKFILVSAGTDAIYEYDLDTNQLTVFMDYVGFDVNYAQDMALDAETGDIYWAAYNNTDRTVPLIKIDLDSKILNTIGYFQNQAYCFAIISDDSKMENSVVPAGTYYITASSADSVFSINIESEPIPAAVAPSYVYPANNESGFDGPLPLKWNFGDYTTQYQLLVDTQNPPAKVAVDWSNSLCGSYYLENISANTDYYWQVNVKNSSGVVNGEVWHFSTRGKYYVAAAQCNNGIVKVDKAYGTAGTVVHVTSIPDDSYLAGGVYYHNVKTGENVNIDLNTMSFEMPQSDVLVYGEFGISAELSFVPDSIDMGFRPDGCWMRPIELSLHNSGSLGAVISSITSDNDFFTISGLELPSVVNAGKNLKFSISSGSGSGTQTGTITALYDNNTRATVNAGVTATAYTPVMPDVWELAKDVVFTGNTFTDTQTGLYDNYRLPGSKEDGPDAVYKIVLTEDVMLSASVTFGDDWKIALYDSDFDGFGGPDLKNTYKYEINNDTVSHFCEGFELGFPDGWAKIDADGDTKTWRFCDFMPNSGNICISSASFDETPLTPDNYLVTPKVRLGENAKLTFYVCAQEGNNVGEHYGVALSTSDQLDPSTFSVIYQETLDNQATWQQRILDLSQYAGENVYIAFRHYNSTDKSWLNIDDIALDGGTPLAGRAKNSSLAFNQVENLKHENETLNRSSSDSGENSCGPAPFTNAVKSQAFRGPESLSLISLWQNSKDNLCTFNLNDPNNCNPLGVTPNFCPNSAAYYDEKCYFSSSSGYFGTIDVNTGELTVISNDWNLCAIEFNPTNGKLYGTDWNSNTSLYEINPLDGTCKQIATLNVGYMISFTITNDGKFILVSANTDAIYEYDLDTNQLTVFMDYVGFNVNYAQDMALDAETGDIYWAAYNSTDKTVPLIKIDLDSKILNTIGYFQKSASCFAILSEYKASLDNEILPAGTYYLVASSTSPSTTVEITKDELPLPVAAYNPYPNNNAFSVDDPVALKWNFGNYTTQYQLLVDTQNPPANVAVDWTADLVNAYSLQSLDDDTEYYWQINERNSSGTTNGDVWKFTTERGYYVVSSHCENGSLIVNKKNAFVGDDIIVYVVPDLGYEIQRIYYRERATGITVDVSLTDKRFLMPASDIEIYTVFDPIAIVSIEPDTLDFGYVPDGYWSEPLTVLIKNTGKGSAYFTSITSDNNFFIVPQLNDTLRVDAESSMPISISCGTGLGRQNGHISLIGGNFDGDSLLFVTATAYTASSPDVWELAKDVVGLPYYDTLQTETLYDNYFLPNEFGEGCLDAVYKLTLDRDVLLKAKVVDGTYPKVALYDEDFGGYGGPSSSNFYVISSNLDDLTVCDNTTTNSYVPVYGYYADAYLKCQYIIPASLLQDMAGSIIKSMKFYSTSNNVSWGNAYWKVYMMETSNTAINQYVDDNNATTVYEGSLSIVNGEMVVDFANVFLYNGGNLLVGFNNLNPSSYQSASFYGQTYSGACGQGYSSNSLSSVPFNQRNFLPKTTFSCIGGEINKAIIPAGTYYLVAASSTEGFSVEITADSIPLPLAAYNLMPNNDTYQNADSVNISWNFGKYTLQYQLLLDTIYPPQHAVVDWTDSLVNGYTLRDFPNLKRYYWQVNERNSSGVTYGEIKNFKKQILAPTPGGVFYVNDDAAGVGDGSSWEKAVSDLKYVLQVAGTMAQKPNVWVAKGVYYGDGIASNNAFTMIEGVDVYGGFAGNEPADFDLSQRDFEENETILDGQNMQRVLYQKDNFNDTTVWDGFTIRAGRSTGYGHNVYLKGLSKLMNCKVIDYNGNYSIYANGLLNKRVLIEKCQIINAGESVSGSYWYGSLYGYYADIKHCTISGGKAKYEYTARLNYSTFEDCKLFNNISVSAVLSISNSTIKNCEIYNNYSQGKIFTIGKSTICNCLIYNNELDYLLVYTDEYSKIINNTIVNNKLSAKSSAYIFYYNPKASNCIIWGNKSTCDKLELYYNYTYSVADIKYCAVEGGAEGEGNVTLFGENDSDLGFCPRFVNPTPVAGVMDSIGECSWMLQDGSLCVNRGDTTNLTLPETDLAGNPRIQNGAIDMGCYESPYNTAEIPEYNDGIIYVKADGIGHGTSWENAISKLPKAMSIAISQSLDVWVAKGTYYGDDISDASAFTIVEGVDVYGGFAGDEPYDYDLSQRDFEENETVLDGQNRQRVICQSKEFKDITIWDGFTITRGFSDYSGGGICARDGSSWKNCNIKGNVSSGSGAGAYFYGRNRNTILVYNCHVSGNVGYNQGGGMYVYNTVVKNCVIDNNSASTGGGVCGIGEMYNCLLYNNSANVRGGISFRGVVMNTNMVNNSSQSSGGVVSGGEWSNCIIWGNRTGYLVDNITGSGSEFSYCAVEKAAPDGTGNIVLASTNDGSDYKKNYVRFVDPANGDFHLQSSSVCIDAGDPDYNPTDTTDLDNNPRLIGNRIDIGCYESDFDYRCTPVDALLASDVSYYTAKLSWTPTGEENMWAIRYGIVDDNTIIDTVSYDTDITLTGLHHNRDYFADVRAVCSDSATSNYSTPVYFTTMCDSVASVMSDFSDNFVPEDNAVISYQNIINNYSYDGYYYVFEWDLIQGAESYDIHLWKQNSTGYKNVFGIKGNSRRIILPSLEPGASYRWYVVAHNECLEKYSDTLSFMIDYLPDLHVTDIVNSDFVGGRTATVEWTVKNDGQGSTPSGKTWRDNIWLSVDDAVEGGSNTQETMLATVENLASLASGESYTNSATVTIPQDYNGNYFLYVMTDQSIVIDVNYSPTGGVSAPIPYTPSITGEPYPYLSASYVGSSNIEETNERDNFFYKSVQVLQPTVGDLYVTAVAHPTNIISGMSMPLSFTVKNQGEAGIVGTWYDAVYISSLPTFNLSDAKYIGSYIHEGSLPVDSTYTKSLNVPIPVEYNGDYYIYVITDVNNDVYESLMEDNNTGRSEAPFAVTLAPWPNLVVSSVTVPVTVSANRYRDVSFTVKNVGYGATSTGSWYDVVYLSRDTILDEGDDYYRRIEHKGNVPLQQDDSYTVSTYIYLPETSGEWYVLVKTDSYNSVFEYTDESDNVNFMKSPVSMLLPDLAITEMWYPDAFDPNGYSRVEWVVKNVGQATSSYSYGYMECDIKFNGHSYGDCRFYNKLNAGDSIILSANVKIGCMGTSSAMLTICFGNYFPDADDTNNTLSDSVSVVAPDLYVSSLSVNNPNCNSGDDVTLSYKIFNRGTSGVQNNNIKDEIYISEYPEFDKNNATLLTSYTRVMNIPVDGHQDEQVTVTIPQGISGLYYLYVKTNVYNSYYYDLCEGANNWPNTSIGTPLSVTLTPYPDLKVVNGSIENDTIYAGSHITVNYSILNRGISDLSNREWTDKFYLSPYKGINNYSCKLIGENRMYGSIAVNETLDLQAILTLPANINDGLYYLIIVTDADNEIYEYTGENNNMFIGQRYMVRTYQLDLEATGLDGPSTVEWGSNSYTIKAINNSYAPSIYTIYDKLYLSTDNTFSTDDVYLGENYYQKIVNAGQEFQCVINATIPYGYFGDMYLIGIVDAYRYNPDINYDNNIIVKPITINSVPTPDLEVSDIVAVDNLVSGQQARIAYTVTNVGEVTVPYVRWNDKIYLSQDDELSIYYDYELKTKEKRVTLAQNESYRDTISVTVPMYCHGSYYLFVKSNANASFYESDQQNNIGYVFVDIVKPLPGDLIVENIESESEIVSGDRLHVSWNIKNIGENTLKGKGLRTLVYMSADMQFDVNDKLLGSVTDNINLPANASMEQTLSVGISGVPEGEYYLIVKTDVTDAFNETDDDNNTAVTDYPFEVSFRVLPYSVSVNDTLVNDLADDYRLNVYPYTDETVRIHLHAADSVNGAVNNMFVSHNRMGSSLNYDYSTIEQYTSNPEIYIPSTQLEYYGINIVGSSPVSDVQPYMIRADILPFEIRTVSPNYGGNTGKVTVEITGSKFRENSDAWLMNDNDTIFADTVYFDSFYKIYATFNLTDKQEGIYTVGVSNLCEGEAFLEDAFEIRKGEPDKLSTNLIYPGSPRPNRNIVMMLEFGNTGNVDINAPVIKLTSIGGSWIALTPEDMENHALEVSIPLQIEGEPQGVLRPGSYGIINVYCYTDNTLVFTITRIK